MYDPWQKDFCEKSQVFNNALKVLIPLPLILIWKPQEKKSKRIDTNSQRC